MSHRILRLPAVKGKTGLSRSTIYSRIAEGKFPIPISLGARAIGWLENEIDEWVAQQIEASREGMTSAIHRSHAKPHSNT